VLEGHSDAVRALAASPVPDMKYVFSGSDDSTVRVWWGLVDSARHVIKRILNTWCMS